jgi:transcriptional regulator with XRE-family HTH domain
MSLLGEAVKIRREELGLDQLELGRRVGVGQQTVSRWETGASVPKADRLPVLAEVLGLDSEYVHRMAGYLPPDRSSPAADLVHAVYAAGRGAQRRRAAPAAGPGLAGVPAAPRVEPAWGRVARLGRAVGPHPHGGFHTSHTGKPLASPTVPVGREELTMSLLESNAHSVAGGPGAGWRERVLEALLPHRGAIANARAAMEHDRAAAWQRQQAALAMARAAGHPVASPPRGTVR